MQTEYPAEGRQMSNAGQHMVMGGMEEEREAECKTEQNKSNRAIRIAPKRGVEIAPAKCPKDTNI